MDRTYDSIERRTDSLLCTEKNVKGEFIHAANSQCYKGVFSGIQVRRILKVATRKHQSVHCIVDSNSEWHYHTHLLILFIV